MKKIILCLCFGTCLNLASSQNLVPNPDFEIYGTVPCGWTNSSFDFNAAIDSWTSPTDATPDIFSTLISPACSNYQPYSTYAQCNGYQVPHSGNIFAGFYTEVNNFIYREYLQVQLTQPLVVGETYKVSMYVSLSDNSMYATNNLGVGFSTALTNLSIYNELGYAPQINFTNVISDTSNWVYLEANLLATDAWQYMIIGNFYSDVATSIVNFNPGGVWDRSYYYVDDVSVESVNSAGPLFSAVDTDVCKKFCIGFTDQSTNSPTAWQWIFPGGDPGTSSVQNPSSICYNNPGTFDVTLITTNANGNDTLTLSNYITVYPTPPIPTITQSGNTLTCSAASTYQWQLNSVDIPGATNQSYEVQQSGYYSVLITDQNSCAAGSQSLYLLLEGIEDIFVNANVLIYPNPSDGDFTIELPDVRNADDVSIYIVNALGQIVFASKENTGSTGIKKKINLCRDALRCAPCGIYFVEINSNHVIMNRKILISD